MTYILFIIGFIALVKGADMLVGGASTLARSLHVPQLVVGLTIVAFGTSAPELAVNMLAAVQGNTDIAIGNILGSNIANILLILGISAIIFPLSVERTTTWKEIPFALLAVVVLAIMANDVVLDGATQSALTRIDGLILFAFSAVFFYYIFGLIRSGKKEKEEASTHKESVAKSILFVVSGLCGLVLGGAWVVDGAVFIAEKIGMSEAVIALTVVAIGTSLPELATSIAAALRRNVDLAVGNVVGSNILNVFWVLGASAVVAPLPFGPHFVFDLSMVVVATLILFLTLFIGRMHTVERWQGYAFLLLYVVYIGVSIVK